MKRTITLLLVVLLALSVLAPPASALKDDPSVPRSTIRPSQAKSGPSSDDIAHGDVLQRTIVTDQDWRVWEFMTWLRWLVDQCLETPIVTPAGIRTQEVQDVSSAH